MPERLTQRQRQILDFITASIDGRGYPPTLREIGEHFGIRSTNGVNDHLKALEKKGYITREDLKSRAMRPVAARLADDAASAGGADVIPIDRARSGDGDTYDVPILGRVAAGEPLLAVENVEDTVRIDRFFLGSHREVFGLRVVGESMIEDGIHDGDYVFVKKSSAAQPGDIVVAMIEGEATVKRYKPGPDAIEFLPANSAMSPIVVHRSEFRSVDILGVVVGVYRKL
jgi:repressor LexA